MLTSKLSQDPEAGFSNTRLHAQNLKIKPLGFGSPIHQSKPQAKDSPEGDNRQFDVWFDYCRLFVTIDGKQTVLDIVDYLMGKFNDVPVWENKLTINEHNHWDNICKSVKGIDIRYRLPNPDRGIEGLMQITFSGKVIASICRHKLLWTWYCLWRDYKARCTRLDINLDDYDRVLPWDEILESLGRGEIYRFKHAHPMVEATINGLLLTGYTFGSRESDIYFRIYDEVLQKDSKGDWIRLEGEYKGDRAKQLFDEVMKLYDQHKSDRNCAQLISRDVMPILFNNHTGLLFIEQKRDENGAYDTRNRGRNKVVDFWHNFMHRVYLFFSCDSLKFDPKLPRPIKTDETTENHLDRSASNSISYWFHVYGEEDFKSRFLKDFEELPTRFKAMANATLSEMQNAMLTTTDIAMQIRQSLQYLDDGEFEGI